MITRKQFAGKFVALTVLPALSLGVFAAPTFAYVPAASGDVTTVVVSNSNNAAVTNVVSSSANTGYNVANGGKGGKGGSAVNSDTSAGKGGSADANADSGNGGDAKGSQGIVVGGDSGSADALGVAGNGGSAVALSTGGAGGQGGEGGVIQTGDASSLVAIQNDINSNDTNVEVSDDCGCDRYNEKYESADSYAAQESSFSLDKESSSHKSEDGHKYGRGSDSDSYDALSLDKEHASAAESHWQQYSKTYVPVTTTVVANNENNAQVANIVASDANTGANVADGNNGGKGGSAVNSDTSAGKGGSADANADSGNGGDAYSSLLARFSFGHRSHHSSDNDPIGGVSGNASAAAVAGNGGDAAAASEGGKGGNGGAGGVIVTGYSESANAIITVANRNVTRIKR